MVSLAALDMHEQVAGRQLRVLSELMMMNESHGLRRHDQILRWGRYPGLGLCLSRHGLGLSQVLFPSSEPCPADREYERQVSGRTSQQCLDYVP